LLEENPFALLDIPCDQIPFWQDVINLEVPVPVTDRLQNEELFGPGEIQTIQEASGRKVNLDLFEVTIDESDLPTGLSPEAVLDQIRLNFNGYAEGADFQFFSRRCSASARADGRSTVQCYGISGRVGK